SALCDGSGGNSIARQESSREQRVTWSTGSRRPLASGNGSQRLVTGTPSQHDGSLASQTSGIQIGKVFVQALPGEAAIERAPDTGLVRGSNFQRVGGRNRQRGKSTADNRDAVE